MPDEQLSPTMRDYLVQIYHISDRKTDDKYVSTSELADALAVSAPAVNRMVSKLREMDLLYHERYRGILLTAEGEREALKQLRRHRIVEAFLVEVMGFDWHEVHPEAERMSNDLGEKLLERMSEMAGNPTHDPHGEPIPDTNGQIPDEGDRLLAGAAIENDYIITRVMTHEGDRLEYLAALGLKPGTRFKLLHAAPFNGPIQLQVGREYRIIGYNLAEIIRVRKPDTV
jgi:DtxR family Mn-dependent transcriptional regulator